MANHLHLTLQRDLKSWFSRNSHFDKFSYRTPTSNFMKIRRTFVADTRSVSQSVRQTDGQTDRQTDMVSISGTFVLFCTDPRNWSSYLTVNTVPITETSQLMLWRQYAVCAGHWLVLLCNGYLSVRCSTIVKLNWNPNLPQPFFSHLLPFASH